MTQDNRLIGFMIVYVDDLMVLAGSEECNPVVLMDTCQVAVYPP